MDDSISRLLIPLNKDVFVQKTVILSLLAPLLFLSASFADSLITQGEPQIQNGKICVEFSIKKQGFESNDFCMRQVAEKEVSLAASPNFVKRYYLLTGDNLTEEHHSATGNIGFSVIKLGPSKTDPLDKHAEDERFDISLGFFGKAPSEFMFKNIGPDNHAFLTESMTSYQGMESGGINIIGENDTKIFTRYIPTMSSDLGYVGDEAIAEIITYTLHFIKDSAAAVYPLQITLNGTLDGITYQQKPYIFHFDETTNNYITPKNYPLNF